MIHANYKSKIKEEVMTDKQTKRKKMEDAFEFDSKEPLKYTCEAKDKVNKTTGPKQH